MTSNTNQPEPSFEEQIEDLVIQAIATAHNQAIAQALAGKVFSEVTVSEVVNVPSEIRKQIADEAVREALEKLANIDDNDVLYYELTRRISQLGEQE